MTTESPDLSIAYIHNIYSYKNVGTADKPGKKGAAKAKATPARAASSAKAKSAVPKKGTPAVEK